MKNPSQGMTDEDRERLYREAMNRAAQQGERRENEWAWGQAQTEAGPGFVGPPSPEQMGAVKKQLSELEPSQQTGLVPGQRLPAPGKGEGGPQPLTPPTRSQGGGARSIAQPTPRGQGGLDPNFRALIDAMTGRRVHRDLSGQQMGLEGVSPQLRYILASMRGRRLNTSGNMQF